MYPVHPHDVLLSTLLRVTASPIVQTAMKNTAGSEYLFSCLLIVEVTVYMVYTLIFFYLYIGKGTVEVAAQVRTAAGVRAKSARRAGTGVRAAVGRGNNQTSKSTVLEVMKSMDVIELTKAPSEIFILTLCI